jgi:arylsulfatase A-like enzyme
LAFKAKIGYALTKSQIDDAVGELIRTLKNNGQYDNTVIVFTSDHGDYLGDFNLMLKGALPFKSITNVPFIWSDPDFANVKAKLITRLAHEMMDSMDRSPRATYMA